MSVTALGGTFELAGRSVARVGFGAMQLPGVRDRPAPPRERAIAVLRRALELGVNHIDTAQFYGDGVANELIREALAPYPRAARARQQGRGRAEVRTAGSCPPSAPTSSAPPWSRTCPRSASTGST